MMPGVLAGTEETAMLERMRQFEGADQIGLYGQRRAPLLETPMRVFRQWLGRMLRPFLTA